jgi:hypothetical protein
MFTIYEKRIALSVDFSSLLKFSEKQRSNDYLYQYTELISEPFISPTSTSSLRDIHLD